MRQTVETFMGRGRRGFTLIEMIVVLLIMGVVMAILITGYATIREKARMTKAVRTSKDLVTAWNVYLQDHGCFPLDALDQACNKDQSTGWYLTDTKFTKFKRDHRKLIYDISAAEESAGLLDPWKNPYRFKLDNIREGHRGGITNILMHPDGRTEIKGLVLVWSLGPDKMPGRKGVWPNKDDGEKQADDILAW